MPSRPDPDRASPVCVRTPTRSTSRSTPTGWRRTPAGPPDAARRHSSSCTAPGTGTTSVVDGRLHEPGRLNQALAERLSEPLFGLYRDLADRLAASGEVDLALLNRRTLVDLLRELTGRIGDPATRQLASALNDLADDLLARRPGRRGGGQQRGGGRDTARPTRDGLDQILVAAVQADVLTRTGRTAGGRRAAPSACCLTRCRRRRRRRRRSDCWLSPTRCGLPASQDAADRAGDLRRLAERPRRYREHHARPRSGSWPAGW